MKSNNLNLKREAFCQAYIRLGEATAAYKDAGYSYINKTDKSIHEAACRLLNNSKVSARIEELQSKVADIAEKKFNITTEEMLKHLNILRNSRIDEYVEFKDFTISKLNKAGKKIGTTKETRLVFKTFDKLTKVQLMCIESIKETRYGIEIKLHGKEWTIEKINKHIGFYEKDNDQKSKLLLTSEDRDERIRKLEAKGVGK